ncbi:hypothetical protein NP233_g1363 [Leucocoprinus birnbaumii]|uniref:Nephrocystin 3-like N-terminal domain-containing protein n=1 Tax=Leucocoprinus birnbaumii TaxID=56174 RepID=A0AAD5W0N5_9AGAR|nr:hypothetical protein NP233_g1363 [Leucocoprinus birnbaumii]
MPVLQTVESIVLGFMYPGKRRFIRRPRARSTARDDGYNGETIGISGNMGPGAFAGAHHFQIHGANLNQVQIERLVQVIESSESVIKILQEKRAAGAEVDSSERYPPPKCHPFTRKQLRSRIKGWREDKTRSINMFWLLGPAGVGKSAVAQTVGEEYKELKRPLSSFFFSRPNRRDDATTVIPTLVLQLVSQIPEYKHLVTEIFAADPNILERDLHTQFKVLLVDPFRELHSKKPFEHPILIILDGLDECNSKEAQCEFINLISDHVRLRTNSPLIWLVCSRPEWHLKRMLSDADFGVQCRRDEVSVDDEEAKADVLLVLRDGLQEIQQKFHDRLPKSWPGEPAVAKIAEKSFNLFIVVTTIVRFIGDINHGNPDGRLQACLQIVENQTQTSSATNLFGALDLLYDRILADIEPTGQLPTAMSILCLRILYPGSDLCASTLANVLRLESSAFYAALNGMHSILLIPPLEYADKHGVQFYHASFQDFLKDRTRNLRYTQAWNTAYGDVTVASMKWLKPFIANECVLDVGEKCVVPMPALSWHSEVLTEQAVLAQVRDIVERLTWDACTQIVPSDEKSVANALEAFGEFDFCHLTTSIRNERQLVPFLNWLDEVDESGSILRRNPTSLTEVRLTLKIGISANALPLSPTSCRLEFLSSHAQNKPSMRTQIGGFFLGSGRRSCFHLAGPQASSSDGWTRLSRVFGSLVPSNKHLSPFFSQDLFPKPGNMSKREIKIVESAKKAASMIEKDGIIIFLWAFNIVPGQKMFKLLSGTRHDLSKPPWLFYTQRLKCPNSEDQILLISHTKSIDWTVQHSGIKQGFQYVLSQISKGDVKLSTHIWLHNIRKISPLQNGKPSCWDTLKSIFGGNFKVEMDNVTFLSMYWTKLSQLEAWRREMRTIEALSYDAEGGLAFERLEHMDSENAWDIIQKVIGGNSKEERKIRRESGVENHRLTLLQGGLDILKINLNTTEQGKAIAGRLTKLSDDQSRIIEPMLAEMGDVSMTDIL